MLSELYHLSKNITQSGGEPRLVHADCGEPGLSTNTNFRLVLGPNGSALKLDILDMGDTKGANHLALWTLKKGNFQFFPATRVSKPLLGFKPDHEIWVALKKHPHESLIQLLSTEPRFSLPSYGGERDQAERITRWSHKEPDPLSLLKDFAASFLALTQDSAAFGSKLLTSIKEMLQQHGADEKSLKALQTLVCGSLKAPKNKPPSIECKVQIIFDYQPEGQLTGCLYTPQMRRVVLECLNAEKPPVKKNRTKNATAFTAFCAFEGDSPDALPILDTPYPDWSAKPVIGKAFKPYSKFSDAPCNFRYGHADTAGFPIGSPTAKAIVGFASSITTEDRRGITWQGIRNGKFDNRAGKKIETFDALIAYPSFSWGELAPVSIFTRPQAVASDSDDPDDMDAASSTTKTEASRGFTQVAQSYIAALKEKIPERERHRKYVHLLLLRAISPGQVQLIYSASPNCLKFDDALDKWIASESHLPNGLQIPLPSKIAKNGLRWFRPRLLFPEEAIRVFTHQWIRGGNESTRVQSPPVSEIFNVFLRRNGVWEQSARELLETLIPRIEPLLIAAGQRIHLTNRTNLKDWNDFAPKTAQGLPDQRKPDPRYYLSQSISLIGTLLHALNSTRSNYMNETPYQLGRLLAAMDLLHKCYCDCERLDPKKQPSYPPTLIGNGLLGRAADSPLEALAELCERSRIYLGWAETAQPPYDEAKTQQKVAVYSARKLLRIISPLCVKLHESTDLNLPMDSQAKAHLFLGYLTRVLGEKEGETPTDTSSADSQIDN